MDNDPTAIGAGIGESAGLDRLRFGRHVRGFHGPFPRRTDSGGRERPGQPVTQGGNDRIMRALMLAADTARKVGPDLAGVCRRPVTATGHHPEQARCAVANRVANRILGVMCSGRPQGLRNLQGGDITIARAKALIADRDTLPDAISASRQANRVAVAD